MYSRLLLFVFVLLSTLNISNHALAEGTREVAPNASIMVDGNPTNDIAALHIAHPAYDNFAIWGGADIESRFHINIQDPSNECIYLGFSPAHQNVTGPNPPQLTFQFRILDPAGNVVYGPIVVDPAGANINSWLEGFTGPRDIGGPDGYIPFEVPSAALTSGGWNAKGDFYIEFENLTNGQPILIDYWDITVVDCSGVFPQEKKGRIWSHNWAFFAINDFGFPQRPFNGAFFVCAPDAEDPDASFVTKIDFNQAQFRPAAFNIVFNRFGTSNTGNIPEDRKSVENLNSTVPEYAVYLNDPVDICVSAERGELSFSSFDRCGPTDYCIQLISTKEGQVDVLLDFDGPDGMYTPGTADVLLVRNVTSEEINKPVCIEWNGLDGLGVHLDQSSLGKIPILLNYAQGIYHFPIYDAEILEFGVKIQAVRPPGPDPVLFYDDTNISVPSGSGEPSSNLSGCNLPCHTWTNYTGPNDIGFGNLNTINSWWFSSRQLIELEVDNPSYLECSIIGDNAICPDESTILVADLLSSPDTMATFDSIVYHWNGPSILGPTNEEQIEVDKPGLYELFITYKGGPDRICETSCSIEVVVDTIDCCEIEVTCPNPFEGGTFECILELPDPYISIEELVLEGLVIEGELCFPLLMDMIEGGEIDPACDETGEWVRTYRIYSDLNDDGIPDPEEEVASCDQTFNLLDTVAPELILTGLPNGLENGDTLFIPCTGEGLGDLPGFENVMVEVIDNCGEDIVPVFTDSLIKDGDCAADGFIAFFGCGWSAADLCGNASSFNFYVMLVDQTPPVFIAGVPDITINCEDELPPALDSLDVYEECSCAMVEVKESIVDGSCPGTFTIERSYIAKDHCGNMTSLVQNIYVQDVTAPIIEFSDPLLEEFVSGDEVFVACVDNYFPDWIYDLDASSAVAYDNCNPSPEITYDLSHPESGECQSDGYILKIRALWIADDGCGNQSNAWIDFFLVDYEAPKILDFPSASCPDLPDPNDLEVSDNCGVVTTTVQIETLDSDCSDGDLFIYNWTVSDACGNTTTAEATYYPNDDRPPNIWLIDPDLSNISEGDTLWIHCSEWDASFWSEKLKNGAVATDGCDGMVDLNLDLSVIPTPDCIVSGWVELGFAKWEAVDNCGNLGSRSMYIGVKDPLPPIWPGFEPEIFLECNAEIPSPSVIDNCGAVQIIVSDSTVDGVCPELETIYRHVQAFDMCGHKSNWNQIIHFESVKGPVFDINAAVVCSDVIIEPKATDRCTGETVDVTLISENTEPGCGDKGVIIRVWEAEGSCNTKSTFEQTYLPTQNYSTEIVINRFGQGIIGDGDTVVIDCAEPVLSVEEIRLLDNCDGEATLSATVNTISQSCEVPTVFKMDRFDVEAFYPCGVVNEVSFYALYRDNKPPVFNSYPQDITVACQPEDTLSVGAIDDCSNVIMEYSQRVFDNSDGTSRFQRFWVATDYCGNSDTITQNIFVGNTWNCSIDVPSNVECFSDSVWVKGNINGGTAPFDYSWNVSGGGCLVLWQGGDSALISIGYDKTMIHLTVTDSNGCMTDCEMELDCILKKGEPGQPPISSSIASSDQIEIYPNPASSNVVVSFPFGKYKHYQVYDLYGKLIRESDIDLPNTSIILELGEWPDGLYHIMLEGDGERKVRKFVVRR